MARDESTDQPLNCGTAKAGWIVIVSVRLGGSSEDRPFAVGALSQRQAEEDVLRFPGLIRTDPRTAQRPLTAIEIEALRLRHGAVRPYDLAFD